MQARVSAVHLLAVCGISALLMTGPAATAAVTGPVYPPPGGVTFADSGTAAGSNSGRTLYYTGMNPASYSELDWTLYQIVNPYLSTVTGFTGYMNFASYTPSTGIALWTSSSNTVWLDRSGVLQSFPTQLRVQFQPYFGVATGLLSSGWLVPSTASALGVGGLPGNWPVLDVDAVPGGVDRFQVWARIEAAGVPLLTLYDNNNSGPSLMFTGWSGGFFYAAPLPVPEPASALLMGLGLVGLLCRSRARAPAVAA